ncbi:MAG TPA: hypothetical protein DDW52_30405 [Planctomycetaceae bacterium]|nr:hypothetical protein [Planctomycetaceae bacterium]
MKNDALMAVIADHNGRMAAILEKCSHGKLSPIEAAKSQGEEVRRFRESLKRMAEKHKQAEPNANV